MAGSKKVTFTDVTVIEKWVSKKGTKCTKVAWMGKEGTGEQVLYDDDLYDGVVEGTTITFSASQNGDFYRNIQLGAAPYIPPAGAFDAGPDEPATKKRSRRAA